MSTQPNTNYRYDYETAIIYRGSEHVATRRPDGTLDYAEGMARYRAPALRYLNTLALTPQNNEAPSSPTQSEPLEAPDPTARATEIWAQVKTQIAEAQSHFPPDAPPTGPYGDLDPTFSEWYIKHHPERAILRYANRKFHLN